MPIPELGYDVHRTAASVAEKLTAFGCDEVVTGIGRTGVVGVIRGRKPADGAGGGRGVIGLRADMDALPIAEESQVPYRSSVPGKMHACGHDGHTAMLLGAAKYLAETRNFAGTAVMIFQPAEEGGAGGRAMVQDGLMERFAIQEVYGMHNLPTCRWASSRYGPGRSWRRPTASRSTSRAWADTRRGRTSRSIRSWSARKSSPSFRRSSPATSIRSMRPWCRSACSRPATPATSSRRPRGSSARRAASVPRSAISWSGASARSSRVRRAPTAPRRS